jgi:glycogen debranching enzyme
MTPTTEPMNADDWSVPAVGTGAVTLVSGRDFAISDTSGDMVRGAVHGLIHDDHRHLDVWSLRVDGHELRALTATAPTPFSAVFVGRIHALDGRPLPLLVIRRRSVGHGMRESIEVHNSGRTDHVLTLRVQAGADFSHLFDVKASIASAVHGTIEPTERGLVIAHPGDAARHTLVELHPAPAAVDDDGWSWRVDVGAHRRLVLRAVIHPAGDHVEIEPAALGPTDEPVVHAVDELSHHRYEAWQQRLPTIVSADPRLVVGVRRSLEDLASLRIFDTAHPELAVIAAGAPWYMTLFGRDALLTSYMALPFAPELACGVLHELAELQGRTDDAESGEEPGKIMHELRSHGGTGPFSDRSRYYGTVDATPLYVMVAAEAVRWGAVSTVDRTWLLPAVDAALDWIRGRGDSDGDGFVDYAPHHDRGLVNQGWKDSWDGVNSADGSMPRAPIALVEVQAYTYAALRGAAEIFRLVDRPDDARRCDAEADVLRAAFNQRFWDDRGWFVEGLDGDGEPIDSLGSNPGHALWTGIADPDLADCYLDHVVSDELWTGWGVRTLATTMAAYDPLSYHNGSVWPHDTAICLAGAARYGRWDVVDRITDGLLDAAMHFGGRLPELFAGLSRLVVPVPVPYPGSCSPQAWAAASVLLVLRANLGLDADVPNRRVFVHPEGQLVRDVTCDRLMVGGRRLSIQVTDGVVSAAADGIEIVRARRRYGDVTGAASS